MKKTFLVLAFTAFSFGLYAQKVQPVFNHIGLYVSNVDVSAAFYSKLLHLDTIKNPWPGAHMKWLSLGGNMQLHLIGTEKANLIVPKGNHIAFSVASIDDFIAVLKKANIPYQNSNNKPNSISIRPDGVKQVYFKDPDGYLVEVNDAK
jgi:lactoylglutathione lyase